VILAVLHRDSFSEADGYGLDRWVRKYCRTGSGGFGVVRVEVRDLVVLEGGGGDGEGRYFVVEGRQVLLDERWPRDVSSCTGRFRGSAVGIR